MSQRAGMRPPERIGDDRLAPLAAERRVERVGGPLSTVGDRQLDRLATRGAHPARQRRGRVAAPRGRL